MREGDPWGHHDTGGEASQGPSLVPSPDSSWTSLFLFHIPTTSKQYHQTVRTTAVSPCDLTLGLQGERKGILHSSVCSDGLTKRKERNRGREKGRRTWLTGAGLVGRGQDGKETVEISNRAVQVSKPSAQARSQISARPGAFFNV